MSPIPIAAGADEDAPGLTVTVPAFPAIPALPEPVHHHEEAIHQEQYLGGQEVDGGHMVDAAIAAAANTQAKLEVGPDGEIIPASTSASRRRSRKLTLTFHEALTFAPRGVYVDIDTNQLRCSCNHKVCDKWDQHGYTRHFAFKCHKKYEEERLDEAELARLREAKATYVRMNPIVEETSIRKKRKLREGEKMLSVEELRVQERHWMAMWKDSKNELKELRNDLKEEVDEEVRAELITDIDGLKKRKGDWGRLLGMNEAMANYPPMATVAPSNISTGGF